MTEMRPLTWMEALLLGVILLLAAGARAGYLIACTDSGRNAGPLLVETLPPDLDLLVGNLKNKQRFAVPSPQDGEDKDIASLSPGYPVLTAAVGSLVDDAARPSTMRWLQCGLSTLTVGLYFLFARRAFRSSLVAVLTGLLCALHPFWILDTAALADGTTATFLLALVLFFGGRASQTSGALSSLLYGLALAALALVRAALLPFAFVALAWFLLRSRTLTRGWLAALLAFLGFVNGLAPWTVRNWQLFGQPLPIVDSAYYHLWIGNKPPENQGAEENAASDSPTRDGHYANEILREMRDRPAETVHRRLQVGLYFIFGKHWFTSDRLADLVGSQEELPTWLAGSYPLVLEIILLVLVVLGLLGWRWTYGWRFSAMPSSLAMIWVPLPYILSHAEALSGPRLPLDGVLLCYTAFVLACVFPGRGLLWAGEAGSGLDACRSLRDPREQGSKSRNPDANCFFPCFSWKGLSIIERVRPILNGEARVMKCSVLGIAAAVLLLIGLGQARAGYEVTDLGSLGAIYGIGVSAINDSDQLAGSLSTAPASSSPFSNAALYSDGKLTNLGTLGGDNSIAHGINDSGQVVGEAQTSSGTYHAFLYSNGVMTDLGTLPGGNKSVAYGINARGQVVGYSTISGGAVHAFIYSNGVMTDLGTLGGTNSVAYGINANGQVVGQADTSTGAYVAFLDSNGKMTDLGALPGDNSSVANSINTNGQVVGESYINIGGSASHAFLYSNGKLTDLGSFGGVQSGATGINDSGQVVGWSDTSGPLSFSVPFVYSNETMTDINSL